MAGGGTLTVVSIRNAKLGEKAKCLFDGVALYLEVTPSGARYWRLKYRHGGKEKRLSLGVFPEIGLSEARIAAAEARSVLREGLDPSQLLHGQGGDEGSVPEMKAVDAAIAACTESSNRLESGDRASTPI